MKYLLTIVCLLFALSYGKGQVTYKEYRFPQVGWRLSVPSDLTIMDSAAIDALNRKGATAVGKTLDTVVDFSGTRTLISITKGQFNYFSSTITAFDPAKDGDYNEASEYLKSVILTTFKTQAPGMQVDTSSHMATIDGLSFQAFRILITYPNKMVLNLTLYSKLYRGYDYGITICYADEATGAELKKMLESSKFESML